MSCQSCNSNSFVKNTNYNNGAPRIFRSSDQTVPVKNVVSRRAMVPTFGGVGYSPSIGTMSSISAYPSLMDAYNNQPQQPSTMGYPILAQAYGEVKLSGGPYSARQSLSSSSIYGTK